MIQNTKCECGHQNPVGTVLCESCGNPLLDEDPNLPLEMRYDGMARRSQKADPTWLDQIWNFFSSVKIAVYLIIITLVASALGTVLPQESGFDNIEPSVFYQDNYGAFGHVYYLLGLSHTYSSWWFITLLFMIGTSLVVCSLDRVLPLYRALSKQQLRKHPNFLLRQKAAYEGELPEHSEPKAWTNQIGGLLKKYNYKILIDSEGTALLAEKYRFSRWGPYINHIGLIIFLLAVLMLRLPGWHMDQNIALLEGETKQIPHTSYYLKNEKFSLELYNKDEMSKEFKQKGEQIPKTYDTKAILYHCTADCDDPSKEPVLEEVNKTDILVNKPLDYKGLKVYQVGYQQTPLLISVKPSLKNKQNGEVYGSFELPMNQPKDSYTAGPYTLKLKGYFPEFGLDAKKQPMTKSNEPKAPAFIFIISGPGLAENGEPYLYFPRQIDKETFSQDEINGSIGKKLELSVGSMEGVKFAEYTTYLNIRVAKAMPYIWTGLTISLIGLIMGAYWQHRRIWLRIDDRKLTLGAHTNKNWFGIRNEAATALTKSGIVVTPKSLDSGGKLE